MGKIKAISLWEPWASLIATGAKTVETRSWHTKYRGELLICAAKKRDKESLELLKKAEFANGLMPLIMNKPATNESQCVFKIHEAVNKATLEVLNFGKAVAIVEMYDCIKTEDFLFAYAIGEESEEMENEIEFGDYSDGRFAWLFKNIRRIKEPFPVKGSQGFFNVELPENIEFEFPQKIDYI